jgi:hypothetical protein
MWLFAIAIAFASPIRLAYTGDSGGIGSGTYHIPLLPEGQMAAPHHAVWVQGDTIVVAPDHRVDTLLAFLDREPACEDPIAITSGVTDDVISLGDSSPANPRPWTRARRVCSIGGSQVVVYGDLPVWDLNQFEFRLGLTLSDGTEWVAIPRNEAARRFSVLARITATPDVMYVDAGSFVDGASSVRAGSLSLHRPIGFDMLRRLGPDALALGATELAGGAAAFFEERGELPYVAANWQPDDAKWSLPASVIVARGAQRIGFVGVIDPNVPVQGATLTDPASAVQGAIDALQSDDQPPDAIVVLGTLPPALLATLRANLVGVDLFLGDAQTAVPTVSWLTARRAGRQPLTLPLGGVGLARLDFDDGLSGFELAPEPVPATLDPDKQVLAAVSATRAAEYPSLQETALSLPAQQVAMTTTEWERLVCEAVAEETDADLVLLPDLPRVAPMPGPPTELQVVDRLAMLDVLEVHWVAGDRMAPLLQTLYGVPPLTCGAPLGERYPKARGRLIEDDRMYRVVTTDRARENTEIGALLASAQSSRLLDQPRYRTLTTDHKHPLTLRSAVLKVLRDQSDPTLATFLERSPNDKEPMWLMRVNRFAFSVERFQGAEDDAFATVPETLATSPSSLTIAGDADLSVDYSSRSLNADLRFRSAYTRLSTESDKNQETADDWTLSSSATLPGLGFPRTGFGMMPFGELLFDSEYTAGEADDGAELPRQADLSLTAGLSARRVSILRALRIGGFGNRDLAVPEKPLEFGARLDGETRYVFGPGLRFTTLADVRLYARTLDDDASDLSFRGHFQARLALPLARWLDVQPFAQAFVFHGRVPETQQWRASWSTGLALDLSGAFQL